MSHAVVLCLTALGFIGVLHLISCYIIYPAALIILSRTKNKKNEYCQHPKNNGLKKEIEPLPPRKATLTLIVPFYNELSILNEKLKSIKADNKLYDRFDIILVNDGNPEYSAHQIKAAILETELKINGQIIAIKLNEQRGKSFAQYTAALRADSEYLLFSDADSLFAGNYFINLYNYIISGFELTGGLLKYKISGSEQTYWNIETKIKLLESDAGLWNTGLFGSNILIKRELYLTFPYYTFCDFSLPLYYQTATRQRIELSQDLIVYENGVDYNIFEIFRTKSRIVRRAIFGFLKFIKFSSNIELKMLLQLYFHKISRWLTLLWLSFTAAGIVALDASAGVWLLIFLIAAMLIFFIFHKRRFLFAATTIVAAAAAVVRSFYSSSLDKWTPSKK